jgi:hypothetical protein
MAVTGGSRRSASKTLRISSCVSTLSRCFSSAGRGKFVNTALAVGSRKSRSIPRPTSRRTTSQLRLAAGTPHIRRVECPQNRQDLHVDQPAPLLPRRGSEVGEGLLAEAPGDLGVGISSGVVYRLSIPVKRTL